MAKPFCTRCLLQEFSREELYKDVERTLSMIPEPLKADATTYQSRLSACLRCDELYQGTCRVCGCYVEVRAAYQRMHCPDVHAKW